MNWSKRKICELFYGSTFKVGDRVRICNKEVGIIVSIKSGAWPPFHYRVYCEGFNIPCSATMLTKLTPDEIDQQKLLEL